MAEQRYLLSQPCFEVRQRARRRVWVCRECGWLRESHRILIVEDQLKAWRVEAPRPRDLPAERQDAGRGQGAAVPVEPGDSLAPSHPRLPS